MNSSSGSGSIIDQLKSVWRQTGIKPKELDELVELPEVFQEVWSWLVKLNQTRSVGFGVSCITYTEMKSFFDLYNIKPMDWEIQVLERFDRIAVETLVEMQEKNKKKKN